MSNSKTTIQGAGIYGPVKHAAHQAHVTRPAEVHVSGAIDSNGEGGAIVTLLVTDQERGKQTLVKVDAQLLRTALLEAVGVSDTQQEDRRDTPKQEDQWPSESRFKTVARYVEEQVLEVGGYDLMNDPRFRVTTIPCMEGALAIVESTLGGLTLITAYDEAFEIHIPEEEQLSVIKEVVDRQLFFLKAERKRKKEKQS